jgi:hypothetical protein
LSFPQSRHRGVASTYRVLDTPATHPGWYTPVRADVAGKRLIAGISKTPYTVATPRCLDWCS